MKESAGLPALTAISLAAIARAASVGGASSPRSHTYNDAVLSAPIRHSDDELHASLCDRQNARMSGDTIAALRS